MIKAEAGRLSKGEQRRARTAPAQEHMHFDYSQTLPQGAWSGAAWLFPWLLNSERCAQESMEPAEPEYPLMTMEIAKAVQLSRDLVPREVARPRPRKR